MKDWMGVEPGGQAVRPFGISKSYKKGLVLDYEYGFRQNHGSGGSI